MKSTRQYIIAIIAALTMLQFPAQAQVIGLQEVSYGQLNLNECGESDTIALEIYNCCSANTLTNINISDTLPSNIVLDKVLPNPNINNISIANSAIPVISLDSLGVGQADTIYIVVSAECGAKAAASALSFGYYANWIDNSIAYSQSEKGRNIYAAIRQPNIQLLEVGKTNFTNATVGDSYCRKWKIQNSGIGSTIDTVLLTIKMQPGLQFTGLKINNTVVSPTITNDSILYTIPAHLRNVGAFTGDTIIIEECFTVASCLDNISSSSVNVKWGCDNMFCDQKNRIGIVRLSSSIPHIETKHTYKMGCYGGYDTLIVRMINKGGVAASNITFDMATGYHRYTTDRYGTAGYADTGSFTFYTSVGPKTSVSPSVVYTSRYNRSYFPISNHPYRTFTNLPNISSGDTLFFEALLYRACLDYTGCSGYSSIATNYDISYSKQCVTGANYSLPIRKVANHEGRRGVGELDGPTDLSNGDTATFKFCFTSTSSNSFKKDNDNGFLKLQYTMPTGLIWTNDLSDLALTNGTYSDAADSVSLDSTNNILSIFYDYNHWIARGSRTGYCITPKFYLDCSSPGASGGTNTLSVEALDNFTPECSNSCEVPYTCPVNFLYNAHCPSPCIRGGFNPKVSFIERLNLGLPDNDEDGLPDASGSLDLSEIEIDRVVAQDTFMLTYAGTVIRGPESPDSFLYGYGTSKFPNNGNLVSHYKTEARIWDASTNSTFMVTGIPASGSTSGGERTFGFDYSTSTANGYPSNFVFDDGDSITILAQFIFNATMRRTNDLVNVVENFYYLSHYANPTSDTAKYRCDRWNAKLKTTDAYFTVWSPEVNVVDGCNEYRAIYRSYLSIGECCSNYSTSSFFKKEYRAYAITDSLRVYIPNGYQIDSANILLQHGTKVGSYKNILKYSVTPSRLSGDKAVYNIGEIYTTGGGNITPSRGGFVQYLYVYYKPSCAVPANVELPRKYDIFMKGVNTWQGNNRQWLNYGSGSVKFISPVLSITNQGTVVSDGAQRVISWEVKLQNDAASAAAEAAWLSFAKPGSNIVVDSVLDIAADTMLAVSNGIFQAGQILGGGSTNARSFRAYAVFNSCNADSIMAYGGWDCNDYPTSLNTDLCNLDSTILIVNPVTSVLQIDTLKAVNAPVEMCDKVEFIISVSQRDLASAYQNTLDIDLPAGLTIISDSSYVYSLGDNVKTWFNPSSTSVRTKRFDISTNVSHINTNGLREFASSPANEYQLRILLAIDCDFESGSKIVFRANGTAPCGAIIEEAKYVQTILIKGAPAITYQVPEIRLQGDTLWGCDDSLSINAVYHNFDTTASSVGHKFRVTLPAGFSLIPNSAVFSRHAFTSTQPAISYRFGQQVLTWSSAGNTPASDSSVWSFNITSGSSACGPQSIVADITEDFVATCVADGSICSSTSIVNSTSGQIITAKADIRIVTSEIQVLQDTLIPSIPDSMTVRLDLRNSGLYNSGSIHVEVFIDRANDNTIGTGDTLIIDTILNNLAPFYSNSQFFTMTAPNGALSCDAIIRISPECACTETIISMPGCNIVRLPVSLTRFTVKKDEHSNAKLQWNTSLEINADRYVVQRSLDGKQFKNIGEVKAAGNSNENLSYKYLDKLGDIEEGTIFYRIKTIDFDKKSYYSATRKIHQERTHVKVYPNPANEMVTVECDKMEYTLRILNASGIEVHNVDIFEGNAQIHTNDFRPGIYIIQVLTGDIIVSHKRLIVAH